MFTAFLIGTLTISVLVLVLLLALPKKTGGQADDRLPIVGIALAILLAALAFIGGLAVSG